MSRLRRTTSGFTLIELVLVLAIIAVTMLAVAPTLGGFVRGRGPVTTAGQFVAVAHWARTQAVAEGTTFRLNMDTRGGKWWLTMDNGISFVNIDSSFGAVFNVPEGVRMESDARKVDANQVIEFDSSGRVDPALVKFIGSRGGESDAICETPMDSFHVVDGGK